MTSTSVKLNLLGWENGTGLAWSVERYAAAKVKEQAAMLRRGEVTNPDYPESVEAQKKLAGTGLEALVKLGAMFMGVAYPPERNDIVRQLLNGQLLGFGFKVPRELADHPQCIPPRVWTGTADFGNNSVTGVGYTFADIRILSKTEWHELGMSAPASTLPAIGRPTFKAEISLAIEAEHAEKSLCETYREPGRVQRIRDRLTTMHPENAREWADLNDETINKYRREHCRQMASKQVQPKATK